MTNWIKDVDGYYYNISNYHKFEANISNFMTMNGEKYSDSSILCWKEQDIHPSLHLVIARGEHRTCAGILDATLASIRGISEVFPFEFEFGFGFFQEDETLVISKKAESQKGQIRFKTLTVAKLYVKELAIDYFVEHNNPDMWPISKCDWKWRYVPSRNLNEKHMHIAEDKSVQIEPSMRRAAHGSDYHRFILIATDFPVF